MALRRIRKESEHWIDKPISKEDIELVYSGYLRALTKDKKYNPDLVKLCTKFHDDTCPFTIKFVDQKDPYKVQATLYGPPNTPYENGVFFVSIKLPQNYPFAEPKVKFETKIYHCNINDKGGQCVFYSGHDLGRWSPAFTIVKYMQIFYNLLKEPNPTEAVNAVAGKLFKDDRAEYNRKALQCTKKYAF